VLAVAPRYLDPPNPGVDPSVRGFELVRYDVQNLRYVSHCSNNLLLGSSTLPALPLGSWPLTNNWYSDGLDRSVFLG